MADQDLGRSLRRLRRLAGFTQEELAERSGVCADVIRQLEQGRKHSARLPTLHALAGGLGVELTALLDLGCPGHSPRMARSTTRLPATPVHPAAATPAVIHQPQVRRRCCSLGERARPVC